ncbi:hypothetical protein [Mycoplasmopsis bovis]|uniref:hypothetical protein n=1 Tax=Mycoplasmopsis bovis TaxID=28903 RepID=UPI0029621C6A|nr:hypothetical protein [Mycoplasmopsis bovis]
MKKFSFLEIFELFDLKIFSKYGLYLETNSGSFALAKYSLKNASLTLSTHFS